MLAYLQGKIINKSNNYVIVENQGLGYLVFVSESLYNELILGEEKEFYLHHQVREDQSDLYGFKTLADLELFSLLITVSNVGPKTALGVLSIASTSDIKEAIIRGDADLLTKVSGIGKKTAERLVLELKSKLLRLGATLSDESGQLASSDEIDALMTLGYNLNEARTALQAVDPQISDSGERVKQALKKLVKQ